MASSSSGMGSRSTRPQVFINFRGRELRRGFISFLEPALESQNVNVFIDEQELRGRSLQNLFVRIEESKVALVIFSKEYANSEWCLDELAKIKECMDLGNLDAIPIFYKIESSIVKQLRGYFGDSFTDLKSRHKDEPDRTRKWEEALASVSQMFGWPFPENSDRTERELINLIVVEVKRVLENVEGKSNKRGAPKAPQQDVSRHLVILNVRQLRIRDSHNANNWIFESISESATEAAIEVANMIKCYDLHVRGELNTKELVYGKRYEVVFVVKVEDAMRRGDAPATAELMLPDNGVQKREFQFVDLVKNEWTEIRAGVFKAEPHKKNIEFYLQQDNKNSIRGLLVKCVIIRPVEE